jgi:hypothetical protein
VKGGTPENRGAARIAERCHLSYRAVGEEGASSESSARTAARTLNLSASGLCLATPARLRPDELLALELTLSDRESPVVAMGRVVWCDPDGEEFRVGVCFTWLRDEDKAAVTRVAKFVDERLPGS